MTVEGDAWRRLCGMAVQVVGGQEAFQREARILKRLVKNYGTERVEMMLGGARLLGWRSLRSLGSAEGLGRRMAETAYRHEQQRQNVKLPERVKRILREIVNEDGTI